MMNGWWAQFTDRIFKQPQYDGVDGWMGNDGWVLAYEGRLMRELNCTN